MKKCTWCGKEYPDEMSACAIDQQPLARVGTSLEPQQAEVDLSADSGSNTSALALANQNMMIGAFFCIGGMLITALTYGAASSEGGSYIVAWGAIIFGGIRFFKGLALKSKL